MAKLINKSTIDWDMQENESFLEYIERQDKMLEDLNKQAENSKNLVGQIIDFPVADGKALYLVEKLNPLTLSHIPYGDAYTVHPALIKGLDIDDIKDHVARKIRLKKLFSSKL